MEIFLTHVPEGTAWYYIIMMGGAAIMIGSALHPKVKGKRWYYAVTVLTVAVMFWGCHFVYSQEHAAVHVTQGQSLTIKAGLGSPSLDWDEIDHDGIRPVKWREDSGLTPVSRDFGTGFPGFAAGWFTLKNGSKAFLIMVQAAPEGSDILIPVHEKEGDRYQIILSLQNPDGFLTYMKGQ